MQKVIEELELDLKELKFLLQGMEEGKITIPIVKRQINRTIKSLEELRGGLDHTTESDLSIQDFSKVIEEQNLVEEESVPVEEAGIAPEVIEPVTLPEEKKEPSEVVIPSATVLGERLRPSTELIKGFSLNDTFRFSRELFNGNTEDMNRALRNISEMSSLSDVVDYLSSEIDWNEESEATKDFIELLKKYFV